jgi:hypothetical protein
MTALSTLYDTLDGDEAYNPVKGVKRPKEAEPGLTHVRLTSS